jgi:hypothetical protein
MLKDGSLTQDELVANAGNLSISDIQKYSGILRSGRSKVDQDNINKIKWAVFRTEDDMAIMDTAGQEEVLQFIELSTEYHNLVYGDAPIDPTEATIQVIERVNKMTEMGRGLASRMTGTSMGLFKGNQPFPSTPFFDEANPKILDVEAIARDIAKKVHQKIQAGSGAGIMSPDNEDFTEAQRWGEETWAKWKPFFDNQQLEYDKGFMGR